MFASLVIERNLLEWSELPAAAAGWLQDVGIIATAGLAIWGLAYALQPPARGAHKSLSVTAWLFLGSAVGAVVCYAVFGHLLLIQGRIQQVLPRGSAAQPAAPTSILYPQQSLFLTLAGACAIFAVCLPVLRDFVFRIAWRRIWAIARLSLKEAWRKHVVWLCVGIPLVYLYADWFLSYKAEDQLRQRVQVVYFALLILLVVTAFLLGSFSIPTDMRSQIIHTITTKPVERYEIFLGRFLGFALLLFGEMMFLTLLSLVWVIRGITPEAADESYRARVPVFCDELAFYRGSLKMEKGESVGREWEYRSYISGTPPRHAAVWFFHRLPSSLGERDEVTIEFTFDIFRTTKELLPTEGKGVACRFTFAHGNLPPLAVDERYRKQQNMRDELHGKVKEAATKEKTGKPAAEHEAIDRRTKEKLQQIDDDLVEQDGLYVVKDWDVVDYHTQTMKVPGRLFKKLLADAALPAARDSPAMQIMIHIESRSKNQLLGVAKRDLYVLEANRPFEINFIKGALGLWLTACLVLGLAVALSTYLSGVITLLTTLFLCGAGLLFLPHIDALVQGRSEGGGPAESFHRLVTRQGIATKLDESSPGISAILGADEVFRWWLKLVRSILPDVTRFDLTRFVANGFDISWTGMILVDQLLVLLAYLVPWSILAYYLMRAREIANPM